MLNKNLSLVVFVALAVASCAPKTTRKPITTTNGGKTSQTDGDQAGNASKPEARVEPTTTPSATPSATPPSPTPPTTTPPTTTPPTTTPPTDQTTPPVGQATPPTLTTRPTPDGGLVTEVTPTPQTPNTALAQIGAPVQPAPELETKPSLQKILWMRLHGDGNSFEPEMSIVASPPVKKDRIAEKTETARSLYADFDITVEGKTTKGTFEFRHPQNGAIEKFNVADATQDVVTQDLQKATDANRHTPMPFEIQIRVPIDDVTQDMLFTLTDGLLDFASRDNKVKQELEEAKTSNPPKSDAAELAKVQAELKQLEAQFAVMTGVDADKRMDSMIRLGISKNGLSQLILKKAFEKWRAVFYDDECVESDPLDLSKSTPPYCRGEFWIADRQKKDIKEFNRYLDDKENVARLVKEYVAATAAVKAEAKRQAQPMQQVQAAGVSEPAAPLQMQQVDTGSKDTIILKTNGAYSGTSLSQPNRIKLVLVGDAFTADQQGMFFEQAQKKWDYLFGSATEKGVEPFRTYRNYFMGVAISTISTLGKACHPPQDDCKSGHGRTFLETQFGTFGIERLTSMTSNGYKHIAALLKSKVPDYDLAAVIMNDPEYGGAGGQYAIVSLDPNANEVIAHELMGHSFAKLGDEYTDPYPSFPPTEEPNTMTDSTRADGKKWASHMLKNKSDLVQAPDESQLIADVVQGSHYHPDGWWRPFQSCKMRVLGAPFCSVCRDTIIKAIYNKIKPIDSITATPALNDKGALAVKAANPWSIKITTLQQEQPVNATASASLLKIQWLVGDKDCQHARAIDGATSDTLTSDIARLAKGNYKVCAKVTDVNVDVTRLNLDLGSANPLEQVRAFDLRIN